MTDAPRTEMTYEEFLASKARVTPPSGFEPVDLPACLFPYQKDLVTWACRRGKAALFADTGLGKAIMALTWAYQIVERTGRSVLILAPLAVAAQFVREGEKFGLPCKFVPDQSEVGPPFVYVTNYQKLHRFDAAHFAGMVADESSILKSHEGRTRTALIEAFRRTPYRLACTATPAPNDLEELGNHAEFLGVCTRTEMLSEYFVHDGGETQKWRIKGHAKEAFWKWVCSWAAVLRKPEDLGYDGSSHKLPRLEVVEHIVSDESGFAKERGLLFAVDTLSLQEARAARKATMAKRVERAIEIIKAEPDESWIVWGELNGECDAVEKALAGCIQVSGADADEEKEERLIGFSAGKYKYLVSKASIAGFGLNWQHCARMIFVGAGFSFESYYQAIRRCWRFGQKRPVRVHVITSDIEKSVLDTLNRKASEAEDMAERMAANTRTYVQANVKSLVRETNDYNPTVTMTTPSWMVSDPPAKRPPEMKVLDETHGANFAMYHGDSTEVLAGMADNTVGCCVTSVPFSSLYTYSASDRDAGNVVNDEQFFDQLAFMLKEVLRVLKPGRSICIHCMDLPTSKERDGFIGLRDFRGDLVRLCVGLGYILHSQVVIWKDPVTAMQRTKALGLLHKTIRKDSSMSRMGIPDYVVTLRKPGENTEFIAHSAAEFPVDLWQKWASPVWSDINMSDTLQYRSARENEDERHIAPLQLEVIRRCLQLWSNKGDIVLDLFGGIGSTGVVALELGRKAILCELKASYYRQAAANLLAAEKEPAQRSLFADT